jgi:hypothetical protein
MKFYKRSRIIIIFAIVAIGLAVYVGLRSMRKEGMNQHLSVVNYVGENGFNGTMKARDIGATPIIWDDPHGDENWEWEEREYNNKAIYLVSRNRQVPEELLLDLENGYYIWKPDPNNPEMYFQITGTE